MGVIKFYFILQNKLLDNELREKTRVIQERQPTS